jgi:methionyl-tRNA formyltransferase
VRRLADDMLETMYEAPGIGLAAIQIAEPQRIVTIDLARKEEPKKPVVLINPEIVWRSDEVSVYEEGCLSIPEYYEEVERPAKCRVRYLDLDGKAQELDCEGLMATCVQHQEVHQGRQARGPRVSLRVVFMGTPDFAVPTLSEILGQGHEVVAVYSRAPKPAGRGMDEQKTPVHRLADRFGIPVFTPRTLREEQAQADFASLGADVAVVVAYGLILPKPVLDAPALGCLNLHGSLLPRWRGAAPIQRAIMAGDAETGVMVMRMDEGLDTGPVAMVEKIVIGPDMTAQDLHDRMATLGADLMVRALAALDRGSLSFVPQADEGVTYAAKIEKAEARIDWSRPASEIHNKVRGLSPFPGAWFEADLGKGPERVKVLRTTLAAGTGAPGTLIDNDLTVACGEGAVRLVEVQRAGAKAMKAIDFLNGAKVGPGAVFG